MNIINDYGAGLGILALVIGAGVYLYGTAKRGRADIVRQDNADLRSSNQELRTEKAGFVATITQQSDTIKNLRDVATQTPAVTQLLDLTAKQQAITSVQHSEVIKQLSALTSQMSKMTAEFSHVATALQANSRAQEVNSKAQEKNTRSRT
jgi:methyl-accepting chemotaxis protein